MTKQIDVRYMVDDNGQQYYPITNIESVEGFDTEGNFEAITILQDDVSGLSGGMSNLQQQINNLQSAIGNINVPSVSDTGWINIPLASGIDAYSSKETPQARLISVNGINFLSLRGGVKGVTARQDVTIGTLSSTFSSKIYTALPFIQNTSVASGEPNYARMRVNTNGTIVVERTSIASPTASQWYPIDSTFMI